MILGPDGGRLHKRHGAVAVAQFRDAGVVPEALVNYLALLGWSHPKGQELLGPADLVAAFGLDRVSGSAAAFDPAKLAHLNAHHLRTMGGGRLLKLASPFLAAAGLRVPDAGTAAGAWLERALAAVAGQMETLLDAPRALGIFFDPAAGPAPAEDRDVLAAFVREAASKDLAAPGEFRRAAAGVTAATGRKGRDLFHPIRIALTGREKGPELDRLVPLIEEGSRLAAPRPVPSCAERLRARLEAAP
jgi:glutamyl/glutaminyl-tRNA synthetase